ncbi:MAG: UDP-glucose 4-epimerase [uncultured Actinomycetospora sp.]|uniref:UDP-glucose 4-epimerase n=1 Tax=uncultured Actinomycetospora sp. TaxID=1135996 RepID=A0A6J4JLY1_9PSEU|nr:MAG: UDP-glucose 4-epimerase [uncultured Actinomycetospora sp.]
METLAARRVLVTGARGFIGSHLLAHLLDLGAEVHAVARPGRHPLVPVQSGRPRVTWHAADLADAESADRAIRESDPDVVFHLASRVAGLRRPDVASPMLEDNTRAAVNVMTTAHRLGGRRVILAGSVEEPRGATEAPCSPYAAAKLAATSYARLFHQQWGLPVTVLRPAMVYGPSQPDQTKLVPFVIGRMLDGQAPELSSGTRPIDWVYVDDVCRAFLAAATHPAAPGLVADVGSGTSTTIADTVDMIAALVGYEGPIGFGELPDRADDRAHVADLEAASRVLGWRPHTSLAQGLAQTVQWHVSRREAEEERSLSAGRLGADHQDAGARGREGQAPRT